MPSGMRLQQRHSALTIVLSCIALCSYVHATVTLHEFTFADTNRCEDAGALQGAPDGVGVCAAAALISATSLQYQVQYARKVRVNVRAYICLSRSADTVV